MPRVIAACELLWIKFTLQLEIALCNGTGRRRTRGRASMQTTESMAETHIRQAKRSHWVRLKRLTFSLLLLWVLVTFVAIYFSRDLTFSFLGWPFNYWMVAQGSLLVYLLITMVYAWLAGRLDRQYDVHEVTGE